jgi:ATP-dependent DNA ligase
MKQIGKTLYKRSTTGKLLEWSVFVDGDSFYGVHGQVDGQKVSDTPTVCTPKNVGRSNETTAEEQAELEAKAKYDKKISINNYCENKADADKKKFAVTLAHQYDKQGHKLPKIVAVSPKLDGIRCYITKDGAFSRNGKPFYSTKFIEADLVDFFKENPDAVLDGELYNHDYKDNFPELVALIKREKNFTDEQWERIEKDLQFHVFDVFYADFPAKGYNERWSCIYVDECLNRENHIRFVPQFLVEKADFMDKYGEFMADGYEGIMLRDPKAPYEMKRSYGLLKYKKFDDGEFEIVDVLEGQGNRGGMAGKLVVRLPNGNTCEAGLRGNQAFFTRLLNEKETVIGKEVTVRYQGLLPDTDALRFPVAIGIRDYE